MEQNKEIVALDPKVQELQQKFEVAAIQAQNLDLQNNACAAFGTAMVVKNLKAALTDDVINTFFKPLMNTKIGFRTDKDPSRSRNGQNVEVYSNDVIRDCIIDGMVIGLLPTGNQFNIIAGNMYPTKEGYTALLRKLGCKYVINVGQDSQPKESPYAEIVCGVTFEQNGEVKKLSVVATVKKDEKFSSADQLRGKAERRAKKALYEYLTGCDFGDADEDSSTPINKSAVERAERANSGDEVSFEEVKPQEQTAKQPPF